MPSQPPPRVTHDHIGRRIDTITLCALYRRTVRLTCPVCNHSRLLDAIPLWYLFDSRGWSTLLENAPRRFYCSICRCESGRIVRPAFAVTDTPFDPKDQFPYPSEYSWKRLVSRYRS